MANNVSYSEYPLDQIPIVAWNVDYNDGTAPASADALYEFSSTKDAMFTRLIKLKVYPRVIGLDFASPSNAASMAAKPRWYRTAQADVPHYGLKIVVYGLAGGQTLVMRMRFIYYFSLKSVA